MNIKTNKEIEKMCVEYNKANSNAAGDYSYYHGYTDCKKD